jgi:hypothetical protein
MARTVTVNITMPKTDDGELSYIAAAPADHRHSYAGSGLPFQSETPVSFEGPQARSCPWSCTGQTRSVTPRPES